MGAKQSSKNDDILKVVDGNIHEALSDVPPDIQKEDFDLPNRTAAVHFLLHDVLSKDECEKIINAGMELGIISKENLNFIILKLRTEIQSANLKRKVRSESSRLGS